MSELKSVEQIQPEVDPRATELALAYIDRRLSEEDTKLEDWHSGSRELPAVWPRDWQGYAFELSPSVREYLERSCAANEEFLNWLREKVIEGNAAWTGQLTAAETAFQESV